MRKLLPIIFVLLSCSLAFAAEPIQLARMSPVMIAGGAGAASCSASTNEIGERGAVTANDFTVAKNYILCNKRQPDCSGTLDTANLYAHSDNSSQARVCVYNWHSDSEANASDTKVSCTNTLLSDSAEAYASAEIAAASVLSDSFYWVCFIPKTNNWNRSKVGAGTVVTGYAVCSGTNCSADDPPDNLGDVDSAWTFPSSTYNNNTALYITVK